MEEREENQQRGYSSLESEEDLPYAEIPTENKSKSFKSIILLLLYYSIIIYSLIYNNYPDIKSNLLFENEYEETKLIINNLQFDLISKRFSNKGIIYKLKQKELNKNIIILYLEYQFNEKLLNFTAKIIEYNNHIERIIKEKKIFNNQLNNKFEFNDISVYNKILNLAKIINLTDLFE
jgi:hypothetical protein